MERVCACEEEGEEERNGKRRHRAGAGAMAGVGQRARKTRQGRALQVWTQRRGHQNTPHPLMNSSNVQDGQRATTGDDEDCFC